MIRKSTEPKNEIDGTIAFTSDARSADLESRDAVPGQLDPTVQLPTIKNQMDETEVRPAKIDGTVDFALDPNATSGYIPNPSKTVESIPGYQLLGELGRGAMGVVFRAKQVRADRIVALKVMLNVDTARPEEVERFTVEAQASARLQHPNIVQVYEVGQVGPTPYFTQEFAAGGPLSSRLSKQLLGNEKAAQILLLLAKAVAYAHSRGVVHRDLKPSNILLGEDDTPKIADFGLARRMDEDSQLTQAGTILGTPSYMAPEQASGNTAEIGPLADVYALGAILYEFLTGRPPFKGATLWEVIRQVRFSDPSPPSEIQPGIPKDLETICLKCLQKEPTKRYESATHLAEDIQRYLNNEPILARPIGRWERLVRLCKRHPSEARLLGLVAMLILCIAGGAVWTAIRIGRQRDEIKKGKEIADNRLELYRDTVSDFVNRAPKMLEGAPLSNDLRRQFTTVISELLKTNTKDQDQAIGPAQKWGLEAISLRQGELDLELVKATRNRSDQAAYSSEHLQLAGSHFDEALRIAQQVYDSNEVDRAKAAGNLAIALSRIANYKLQTKKPGVDEDYRRAIQLRKEAIDAKNTEYPLEERQSELGRTLLEFSAFLIESGRISEGFQNAGSAVKELKNALELMREDAKERNTSLRDLAAANRLAGKAASMLQKDEETQTGYKNAIEILQSLLELEPGHFVYQDHLMLYSFEFGDYFLMNRSEPIEAQKYYGLGVQRLSMIMADPKLVELQNGFYGMAMGYYRLGLSSLGQQDRNRAKEYFKTCELIRHLNLRQKRELVDESKNPDILLSQRIELMLTQGRSGNAEAAIAEAKAIFDRFKSQDAIKDPLAANSLSQAAFGLGLASEHVSEDQRPKVLKKAFEILDRAIDAGYRDANYLQTDPDVTPLRAAPQFAAVIQRLTPTAKK